MQQSLTATLLWSGESRLRPVDNPSEQVKVHVIGALYQIVDVDQRNNLATINAYFDMVMRPLSSDRLAKPPQLNLGSSGGTTSFSSGTRKNSTEHSTLTYRLPKSGSQNCISTTGHTVCLFYYVQPITNFISAYKAQPHCFCKSQLCKFITRAKCAYLYHSLRGMALAIKLE